MNGLELIRQVENVDESVAITKNGVPAAVILSMEKYAGLLETLDVLSDEETMTSLRTSIRQARKVNGCGITRCFAVEQSLDPLHA